MYTVTKDSIDWIQLESVPSTNSYLLEQLDQWQKPTCVTTERQTTGRGRQGKPWVSPPGQQLLFSFYWPWRAVFSPAPLSLVVGKSLAQNLNDFLLELDPPVEPGDVVVRTPGDVGGEKPGDVGGEKPGDVGRGVFPDTKIKIKWPNDLQIEGKKLAGILLESEAVGDHLGVVIGVGINVLPLSEEQVGQPVTALSEHVAAFPDKASLLEQLVLAIAQACQQAEAEGFAGLLSDWHEIDALFGKTVQVTQAGQVLEGIAAGVDPSGSLLLRQDERVKLICSGSVRLK